MPRSKTRPIDDAPGPAGLAKARQPAQPSQQPAAAAGAGAVAMSCEQALARVIELASDAAEDSRETRRRLPSGRLRSNDPDASNPAKNLADAVQKAEPPTSRKPSSDNTASERLKAAFRELDPETALKIRTLMIAGRDGQSIGAVNVNVSLSDADAGFAIMAADSGDNGPLLVDYLRRGHALALALAIDLDRPLAAWISRSSDDLGERAWSSFGRQLANSSPDDWQCLGIIDASTQQFSKLYVKLADHAWWSFEAVLDRPTPAGMEKERRALGRRHLKSIPTNTLTSLVARLGGVQGRALRRAGRAICARVGQASKPSER